MPFTKNSVWVVLLFFMFSAAALGDDDSGSIRIAVGGIIGLSKDTTANETGYDFSLYTSRELAYGGGLLAEAGFTSCFAVELGALFVERNFQIGDGNVNVDFGVPTVYLPLDVKFWLGDYMSLALGPYMGVQVGGVSLNYNGASPQSASWNVTDRNTTEFGGTFAADVNLPMKNKTGPFVEVRYFRGLTNDVAQSVGIKEEVEDILFMVGFRLDSK